MKLDAIQHDLAGIERDMRSISPKTSTYQKLKVKRDELYKRIQEIRQKGKKHYDPALGELVDQTIV